MMTGKDAGTTTTAAHASHSGSVDHDDCDDAHFEVSGQGPNMQELVTTFTRTERHVLMLHYAEELTPVDIAHILDLGERQVEGILADLRQRTKAAVEQAALNTARA